MSLLQVPFSSQPASLQPKTARTTATPQHTLDGQNPATLSPWLAKNSRALDVGSASALGCQHVGMTGILHHLWRMPEALKRGSGPCGLREAQDFVRQLHYVAIRRYTSLYVASACYLALSLTTHAHRRKRTKTMADMVNICQPPFMVVDLGFTTTLAPSCRHS